MHLNTFFITEGDRKFLQEEKAERNKEKQVASATVGIPFSA
jgi:hypothetical protein